MSVEGAGRHKILVPFRASLITTFQPRLRFRRCLVLTGRKFRFSRRCEGRRTARQSKLRKSQQTIHNAPNDMTLTQHQLFSYIIPCPIPGNRAAVCSNKLPELHFYMFIFSITWSAAKPAAFWEGLPAAGFDCAGASRLVTGL
jgi:hypothetical protein